MRLNRWFNILLLMTVCCMSPLSIAGEYPVGADKIDVPVPDGFLALSGVDANTFNSFYKKASPDLAEFYCYIKEHVPEGACIYHRTLKLNISSQFANIRFDDATFAEVRADARRRVGGADKECNACQEQVKRFPEILKMDFVGVFVDSEKCLGYSHVFVYKDHKSVESAALINVNGKIVILHATSNVNSDADIQWTHDMLNQWVKQVLEMNS